jgi:lipoprotein NlpI
VEQEFAENAARLDQAKWTWPIVAFHLGNAMPESIMTADKSAANERARRIGPRGATRRWATAYCEMRSSIWR